MLYQSLISLIGELCRHRLAQAPLQEPGLWLPRPGLAVLPPCSCHGPVPSPQRQVAGFKPTVDSNRLGHRKSMFYAGVPSFFGLGFPTLLEGFGALRFCVICFGS